VSNDCVRCCNNQKLEGYPDPECDICLGSGKSITVDVGNTIEILRLAKVVLYDLLLEGETSRQNVYALRDAFKTKANQ